MSITEKRRMIRWQTDVASDAKPRKIKRTQLTATEYMDRRFRTGLCGCSHPPYTPLMLQLSPCLVVVILYMSLQSILVETKWWSCCRGEGPIDCGGWTCTGVTVQSVNWILNRNVTPNRLYPLRYGRHYIYEVTVPHVGTVRSIRVSQLYYKVIFHAR